MLRLHRPTAPLEPLESRHFLSAVVIGPWNGVGAHDSPRSAGADSHASRHHHHSHHASHRPATDSAALPGSATILDPTLAIDPTLPAPAAMGSAVLASDSGSAVSADAVAPAITAPLAAPVVSFVSSNLTTVVLSGTAATGGSGSYTYQWYRGTSAGFMPSATTLLAGAKSLSLSDSANLVADTPYFYVLAASDGNSTVFSNQMIGALTIPTTPIALPYQGGPVMLAYIGSSTWAINQGSGQVPQLVDQDLRTEFPGATFTTFNGAVSGTTTSSFLPGTALNNTVKAAVQAFSGYKVLRLMIGSNDAANQEPASAWLANMHAIINDALTWPVNEIVVEEIGVREDGGNSTLDLIRQYNAARTSLVGPGVVLGTADTYENESTHLSTLSSDEIHQNNAGQILVAADQATEMASLFTPQPAIAANSVATDSTGGIITATLTGANFVNSSGRLGFSLAGTTATVAWWSVSGSTLTLFLSHLIMPGQAVTLSLSAGVIRDSVGDPLPAFTLVPVQNDVNDGVLPPAVTVAAF